MILKEHRDLLRGILNLLFPPRCVCCGRRDTWLCDDCGMNLPRITGPTCRVCGQPTKGTQVCSSCYTSPLRIQGIRAPYLFDGQMRKAIHKFKYKRARHLAEPLAQLLLEYLDANSIDFDAIVPVPLHEARLAERGYNQSQLLAVELGKALNKAVFAECVKRTRPTQAQMSLPARKRFDNVRGAFQCTDKSLSGSRVLIIDDVCTTGATLEACAVALKRGGVSSAWGLCLARAILDYR